MEENGRRLDFTEPTMEYTDVAVLSCTSEMYIMLFINVTLINLILRTLNEKRERCIDCCIIELY